MSLSLVLDNPSVCKTLAFKAPVRALDWADFLGKEVSGNSKKVFSNSSLFLSFKEMPKKLSKLEGSINSLDEFEGVIEVMEKVVDIFKRFMAILAVFAAGIKIALDESLLFLSERQLNILGASCFLSSIALTLYSAKEIKKSFICLFQVEKNVGPLLLKMVSRICALTTGIFGVTVFAFGEAVLAKWVVLGVSTVSISTSIFKYYYNSLI